MVFTQSVAVRLAAGVYCHCVCVCAYVCNGLPESGDFRLAGWVDDTSRYRTSTYSQSHIMSFTPATTRTQRCLRQYKHTTTTTAKTYGDICSCMPIAHTFVSSLRVMNVCKCTNTWSNGNKLSVASSTSGLTCHVNARSRCLSEHVHMEIWTICVYVYKCRLLTHDSLILHPLCIVMCTIKH